MSYKQFSSANLPKALCVPVLVDSYGIPRYWVTIWSVLTTHDLEQSTVSKKLRHIESLYQFSDALYGNSYLDDILAKNDILPINDLLLAYFVNLRNRSETTSATQIKWQTCLNFVKTIISHSIKSHPFQYDIGIVEAKICHLDSLYSQLKIQKSKQPDIIRSLPAVVVSAIFECLDPDAVNNPFKGKRTRWNGFLTFMCMLHWGLRRGEILLLQVDSIKSEYDLKLGRVRYWVNVIQTEDNKLNETRSSKPDLKNHNSIRQIPVSESISKLIQIYTENYRGKKLNHPFLFNSQWNKPLSHEALSKYYQKISKSLSPEIINILWYRSRKSTISPHDFRHTCAVIRLNQMLTNGDAMDEALQKMRIFFGWSRDSDMPLKYARAVFEDRLSDFWAKITDDRVELLRNIPERI